MVVSSEIGFQLLLDLQDLGNEFALTIEGEKTAVLSLQLANLQIGGFSVTSLAYPRFHLLT